MTEDNGRIIVVGGGIAGLCAGVYGLRCGYDVELIEMHDRPGGLATSWRRGAYTFETCLHWLLGSNPRRRFHRRWREVFDIDRLSFVHPHEYLRLEAEDGQTLVVYTDPDRLEQELLRVAPEDAAEIRHFVGAVREFAEVELPEPPEGLLDWIGLIPALRHLPAMQRWAGVTLQTYGERFTHPLLRRFFQGGETGLAAITVVLTLAWMGRRDADYPIGGSQAVIRPIIDSFLALGGRLRLGERVQEIVVENNVATGVRLADGTFIGGDWVVSAADGHATMYEMLHGRYLDETVEAAYASATFVPFPSYAQVSFGVARPMDHEPRYLTRVLDAALQVDPDSALEQVSFRVFNFDPSFAPLGRTAVTCTLPTRNVAYWTDLRRDAPARYEQEKTRLADAVLAIFERRCPGVRADVEVIDVATPATVVRYTGNWRGSMEGWLMTPRTGLRRLPMRAKGLARFLMAGQWVAPGGGLPGGLMTARAAIQALCRMDGRPFLANSPLTPSEHRPTAPLEAFPPGGGRHRTAQVTPAVMPKL